jgi:ATP-dependent RNA helicase DeaD
LRLIERHVRQTLTVRTIPTRSQIEGKQLEKMQVKVREALAGERMASFLPLVSQLCEEYDPHAIAAAALQMTFDQSRPSWMGTDYAVDDEVPINESNKPVIKKRPKTSVGQNSPVTQNS